MQKWKYQKTAERILAAPESLTVSSKRLALSLFSSQAIIFPFPFIRAARWTVLFPGAEHASRTFTENETLTTESMRETTEEMQWIGAPLPTWSKKIYPWKGKGIVVRNFLTLFCTSCVMFQKEIRHIKVKILNCYGSRINNFNKHYKIAQKKRLHAIIHWK